MNDSHTPTHSAHEPHACPMWVLIAVFAALLVLTAATVFTATQVDLGSYNLLLAMVIAVIKGALVALFFMHLFWDSLFNGIALIAGISFLALFIGFSIVDTYQYEPTVTPMNQVLTPAMIEQTSFHKPADHEADAGHASPAAESGEDHEAHEGAKDTKKEGENAK